MSKHAPARAGASAVRRARIVRSHLIAGRCVERPLKTCLIPFTGDPVALIAAAARLRPGWCPVSLLLFIGTNVLDVHFGQNDRGVQFDVYVDLQPSDIRPLMTYLDRVGAELIGAMRCAYVDEDGGEARPVPRVSVEALADMPTSSLVL